MTQETADQIIALIMILAMLFIIFCVGEYFLRRRKRKRARPALVADLPLTEFDDLPPGLAVTLAWSAQGDIQKQKAVRDQMPILARALDRMVED